MGKKIISFCMMLLVTSLAYVGTVNAVRLETFKVKMPLEFIIDACDSNNPRANVLNAKSDFKSGFKWVALPQVAAMFDPNNPDEPVVLIDVKKAILKLILKNPKAAKQAGIRPEDYINAGISEEELQALALDQEEMSSEEVNLLSQIFNDLAYGDSSRGLDYIWDGGVDVLKAGAKVGLGFAILMRKSAVVFAKFMYESFSSHGDSETASDHVEKNYARAHSAEIETAEE